MRSSSNVAQTTGQVFLSPSVCNNAFEACPVTQNSLSTRACVASESVTVQQASKMRVLRFAIREDVLFSYCRVQKGVDARVQRLYHFVASPQTRNSKNTLRFGPWRAKSIDAFHTARKPFHGACASSRLGHGYPKFGQKCSKNEGFSRPDTRTMPM